MNKYRAWAKEYLPPDVDLNDLNAVYGYGVAAALVQVLTACGDDLSRASIMKQAASLHHATTPVLIGGIEINTSATDYRPIQQLQLRQFNGTRFVLFGGRAERRLSTGCHAAHSFEIAVCIVASCPVRKRSIATKITVHVDVGKLGEPANIDARCRAPRMCVL